MVFDNAGFDVRAFRVVHVDNVEAVEEDVAEFLCRRGFLGVHGADKDEADGEVDGVPAEGGVAFFEYLQEGVLEFFRCSVDFVEEEDALVCFEYFAGSECFNAGGPVFEGFDGVDVAEQVLNG